MIYIRNKLLIAVLTFSVLLAGLWSGSSVLAQSSTNSTSSLVDKVATKFHLNKVDVQQVFDQDREEHQTQMEAKYEDQLSQYVKDGKITEAQKQLILNKHKELQTSMKADRQGMINLAPDERKAKMQAKQQELQAWAKDKGIDLKYLRPFGHGMKGLYFKQSGSPTKTQ